MSMRAETIWKAGLLAGGILTLALGAYHFWLPVIFNWPKYMAGEPATVQWGHYSINFFFSALLVLGGTLSMLAAFRWGRVDLFMAWAVFGMAGFWAVNLLYQLIIPMPLPESMRAVGWSLLGFSVVNFLLHIVPGVVWVRERGRLSAG